MISFWLNQFVGAAQILPNHVASDASRTNFTAVCFGLWTVKLWRINGVVQRVANNTTQLENQMPYYENIIKIPDVVLTKSGVTLGITAGMPLTVDVLGDKRTVMNYVITPIEKSWK